MSDCTRHDCQLCAGKGLIDAYRVISHPARDVVSRHAVRLRCPCCLNRPLRLVKDPAR